VNDISNTEKAGKLISRPFTFHSVVFSVPLRRRNGDGKFSGVSSQNCSSAVLYQHRHAICARACKRWNIQGEVGKPGFTRVEAKRQGSRKNSFEAYPSSKETTGRKVFGVSSRQWL
jgi:hypothetical protein